MKFLARLSTFIVFITPTWFRAVEAQSTWSSRQGTVCYAWQKKSNLFPSFT